jgi:hypothetical protein
MNPAILHEWAIMVHDASRTTGQVADTIYPADGDQLRIEQVLVLGDGTRWRFLLVELRLATGAEAQEYLRSG